MLKHIFRSLLTIFLISNCVACSDTVEVISTPVPESPGSITLIFNNSIGNRSNASDNSEKLIDNLYIGLYPLDASDTDKATAWASFTYLEASQSKVVTMQLNDAVSKTLFEDKDGKECRIFAVANVPEGIDVPQYASIETMKSISVKSDFATGDAQTSFIMTGGNDNVKYSAPAVQGQKGKATGMVNLKRTAAKVRLNVTVPETIEIKDEEGNVKETWHPRKTEDKIVMNVALMNGVYEATVVADEKPVNDGAYFDSDLSTLSLSGEKYLLDVPFYTYPNSWTESINETRKTILNLTVPWYKDGGDSNSTTTFYYQVPLTPAEVTKLESNHSYIVDLTVGMLGSLVPDTPVTVENVSYQIVDWGEEEIEVPIDDSRYLVVNPNVYTFNNETNMSIPYYTSHPVEIVDVKIQYQRFNFVSDPNNPFVGEVVTFTIDENQIETTNNLYKDMPLCSSSLSETSGQKYLNVYHPLNLWTPYDKDGKEVHLAGHNMIYDNLDKLEAERKITEDSISYYKPITEDAFSMYTITCTVRHIDRPEYKEDIIIYQYPAIYIEADRNPASQPNGNVFVNSFTDRASNSSGGVYGSIYGLKETEDIPVHNKNPNMYIINITSLSENNTFTVKDESTEVITTYDYVINDPRAKFCTNGLSGSTSDPTDNRALATRTSNQSAAGSWCKSATSLYPGTNRTLQYYYPTLEDGSVMNVIAPRFRVASSWGVTVGIYRTYARRRAALYQENAYPSGRWRVPTLAEFCYINKLSNEGKIPILFTPNVSYWTSEGLYRGTEKGEIIRDADQKKQQAIRAVYDEWYWSQYPQYSITPNSNGEYSYTLGDVPRGVQ
ncbi:MAG: hypothetical protein K2H46_03815 [Muribaculaceae bacterium]|nr:hypothetical protein [Muribaculaceae bacterium]